MPVSPASFSLILLLCQLTGPAASGAQQELVGTVGGSVIFPLTHSVDQIDSIIWFFESTTLITIQPTTTDKPDTVIVTKNHNKGRVDSLQGNYSLQLSKLSKNDSGAYSVEIHSPSLREPFVQEYGLRVYEQLSKPKITLGLKSNKNGTCVTNLTCFLERGGEDVTYSWKTLGKTSNESHNGSVLPITWTLREKDMTFICMARNPISSNSSNTIFARKLCEGIAGDLGPTMGLWISLLLIVLILVFIILTMWKQTRKESTEEKRMDTHPEIPNCYPPSGETAEYDTISNPNKLVPSGPPGPDPASNAHTVIYGMTPSLHSSQQLLNQPASFPIGQQKTIPEENSVHPLYCTVQIPQKMEKPHSLPTSPDTPKLFIYDKVI